MQERHLDRRRYFREQAETTERHVIPFVAPFLDFSPATRVLEVGCGEGGNLLPFLERGCQCVGVDLNAPQIERARVYLAEAVGDENWELLAEDMYEVAPDRLGRFDFIFLRDVIEHIFDQERFMAFIRDYLAPGGVLFIGFPPWYMPFGGHQQICQHQFLSKLPWIHLLPRGLYRGLLRWAGEPEPIIRELMEIVETGISIERLRRISRRAGYTTLREQLWLINPNYEVKFGLQPRRQWPFLAAIPGLRNVFTTCGYYALQAE
ncbi:MAG: class I SAM-dependent methyltransferase [Lewinella sp.]|nr:class I SAM-dependent methyltransferase [Lewinella sp.]